MLRSLVPWSGRFSRDLSRLEHEFDRLFRTDEEWFKPVGFVPRTDVAETESGFEVTAELPGLKPEEVQVEIKEGSLWISGEKKEEKEEKGKTFHRVERRRGEFRRVLPLPTNVDEEQIEARVEDGVLHVLVPKIETATPRKIEVKA